MKQKPKIDFEALERQHRKEFNAMVLAALTPIGIIFAVCLIAVAIVCILKH